MGTRRADQIWRRSSRCANGACLEMAFDSESVYLRDGKDPDGPVLEFTHSAWRDLVGGIKASDFGRPRGGASCAEAG